MSDPVKVAIVGSGPAGFYAAGQLLTQAGDHEVQVDMYDRLATPWGLVRAGVAPDHPKIKTVTRQYEKTAKLPGFRLHGNVMVGQDVTHDELAGHYHAVLYAIGAATDRRLGIPGEDLPGSHPATSFVAWYNGHPDYCDEVFDLDVDRAVVIGNGNVALDVARMLALNPAELEVTDTADHAIAALKASKVREIVILGRRGPAQAAYTNPELRELPDLADADIVVDPQDMELDEGSAAWLERDGTPTAKRNVEILTDYAQRELKGHHKRIVFRFLRSPVEILGTDRVEGLKVVRNELAAADDGSMRARASEDFETIETGLVLRSIGYKGSPVVGVPFDDRRATFANEGGRILDPESGRPRPGLYAAGWIKRGPSGVIGTNKKCAQETVALLFDDLQAGKLPEPQAAPEDLLQTLAERGVRVVDYDGWESIDEHERSTGEPQGRPRVKLVRHEHLLEKAFAGRG